MNTKTLKLEVPVPAEEYENIMARLRAGASIDLEIGDFPDEEEEQEEESECHVDSCEACAMPAQREVISLLDKGKKMVTVLTAEGDEELAPAEDGMAISGIPADSNLDMPAYVLRCVSEDIDALRDSLDALEDLTASGTGTAYRLQQLNVDAAHSHLTLLQGEVERIAIQHGQ